MGIEQLLLGAAGLYMLWHVVTKIRERGQFKQSVESFKDGLEEKAKEIKEKIDEKL